MGKNAWKAGMVALFARRKRKRPNNSGSIVPGCEWQSNPCCTLYLNPLHRTRAAACPCPFPSPTQTISFTLKSHLDEPAAASALSSLLPGIMEVLAGLIEDELPTAVAPLAAQVGPVIDGKAMDRALNALYRECTTSARAAKAAGRAAAAAAAAGVKTVQADE